MPEPARIGSFSESDVCMLLTELDGNRASASLAGFSWEAAERSLFPAEYQPSPGYLAAVRALIAKTSRSVALLCATLAEEMLRRRGHRLVIVSIARAGTPIGIIIRRWLRYRHALDVPHYCLSAAGRGPDLSALGWLARRHSPDTLQFLDAWTSKGTIRAALESAGSHLELPGLDTTLAVVCDTASCTDLFATREDVLLPHACLGAGMSGLLSRTVSDSGLLSANDFHGVRYYGELAWTDLSRCYIDAVCARFSEILRAADGAADSRPVSVLPDERGKDQAALLADRYGASDIDLVNIGICESTRAFFRRKPAMLLLHPAAGHQVNHLLMLAAERHVPVQPETSMPFRAALLLSAPAVSVRAGHRNVCPVRRDGPGRAAGGRAPGDAILDALLEG